MEELRAKLAEAELEIDRQIRQQRDQPPPPYEVAQFVAAVSKVDLPSFWEADPVLWFRQCESAFRRAGTVSSGVKFDHVVGKLPNAVSLSCRSLLLDINFEDKDAYERLKAHLCRSYGKTKWQLGYALLDSPGLGDRRPSQMLQDMRALMPPNCVEDTIFQCLFLKRLPSSTSAAIMAADLDTIDQMAEMADRLFDQPSSPVVAAVASPCCHIAAADGKRTGSARQGRSPTRSGQSPTRRRQTPGRKMLFGEFRDSGCPQSQWAPGAKSNWCPVHKFHGKKAYSCTPPCTFPGN